MSWWARLFGSGTPRPSAPKRSRSLEEIKAELDAARVTLDRATATSPRRRVTKPASGPLWEPVYAAARNETREPADLTRAEAVCLLVATTALAYQGDGLDNGLLGNLGAEELADALPALREIGAQPAADVLQHLQDALPSLQTLAPQDYFQRLAQYDTALDAAGMADLLGRLDRYLAARYPWA